MSSTLTPEPIRNYGSTVTRRCLIPSNSNTLVVFENAVQAVAPFCAEQANGTIIVAVTEDIVAKVVDSMRREIPSTWKGKLVFQVPKALRPLAKALLRAKLSWRFIGSACSYKVTDAADD